MTDKEIKIALGYCTGIRKNDSCSQCPAYVGCNDCIDILREESLDLIHSLEGEVKNYMSVAEKQQSISMERFFEIQRLKEENERLRYNLKAVLDERADNLVKE